MIPENDFLRIARVAGSHGLRGEVKVYVITDIPERFSLGRLLYLGFEKPARELKIEGFRPMKARFLLLKLEGIDTRDDSDMLKGMDIYIKGSDAGSGRELLDEDSFFYHDLIGCSVYLHGKEFGTVAEIMDAGAGDILVIETLKQGRVMVPFVESMVDTGRINEKIIEINPVEGLFDI